MNTKHVKPLFIAAALLSANVAMAEGDTNLGTLWKVRETGVLTVGYRTSAVPFSFAANTGGEPQGFTIDMCKRAVEAIRAASGVQNMRVDYVNLERQDRLSRVVSGEADLECGVTTEREAREKHVGMSVPVFMTEVRLMVRPGSGISSLADVNGKRVTYTAGAVLEDLLKKRESEIGATSQHIPRKTDADSLNTVTSGQADAWLSTDAAVMDILAKTNRQNGEFGLACRPLSCDYFIIALRRDDAETKAIVDRAVLEAKQSGEAKALYAKWFQSPIQPYGYNLNYPHP